ncbi:MAG: hypothetical protein EON52_01080, partial [Actinomycetales bacterium]
MTDNKDSGSRKPARSTARQGESSVRIPRLQGGGNEKAGRPGAKDEDPTAETPVESTAEVVEVEETEVEREEKSTPTPPAKGRPTAAKSTGRKPAATGAAAKKSPASPGRTSGPQKVSARDEPTKPGGAARSGSAMTAADYARTTRESADSTSVIPAIRDEDPSDSGPRSRNKKPAARVEPATTPAAAASAAPAPGSGRRAELRLVHVEPWSVTKLAFVVSV